MRRMELVARTAIKSYLTLGHMSYLMKGINATDAEMRRGCDAVRAFKDRDEDRETAETIASDIADGRKVSYGLH